MVVVGVGCGGWCVSLFAKTLDSLAGKFEERGNVLRSRYGLEFEVRNVARMRDSLDRYLQADPCALRA